MTLSEPKKHLRKLAYTNGRNGRLARLDKTRYKCIGRQMAYMNAAELLEQLDLPSPPDSIRPSTHLAPSRLTK